MYNKQKIVVTIEARMTSSRLPGKVLMEYINKSNLQHIIERVRRSRYVDEVVVATTTNVTDNSIVELCKNIKCKYFRGSEEDVLLRVLDSARSVMGDIIVEITGDCPVVDWRHIDYLIEKYFEEKCDYAANTIERSFPRGFDIQVFSTNLLEKVNLMTNSPVDHEHVSIYIYTNPDKFKLYNWKAEGFLNRPDLGITLDNSEDYMLIKEIYEALYNQNNDFTSEDVIKYVTSSQEIEKRALDRHRKNPFKEQKEWSEKNANRKTK